MKHIFLQSSLTLTLTKKTWNSFRTSVRARALTSVTENATRIAQTRRCGIKSGVVVAICLRLLSGDVLFYCSWVSFCVSEMSNRSMAVSTFPPLETINHNIRMIGITLHYITHYTSTQCKEMITKHNTNTDRECNCV